MVNVKKKIYGSQITRWKGQTFIEYTLLITIVVGLMLAMTPMLRRSVQGVVKLVADQVGVQKNADQQGGKTGYMISQYTATRMNTLDATQERLGLITYNYLGDSTTIETNVATNLGYTQMDLSH